MALRAFIVRRDGQRLRLITDTLGSVRAVVDADTGAVIQRLSYDAYGRITQDTAPGTQPFGFKGALGDPVAQGAGLVWMGVRAYLPSLGRFTTPDPAGLVATWNQHDALSGDPINLGDVDGRMSAEDAVIVGAGAALAPEVAVPVVVVAVVAIAKLASHLGPVGGAPAHLTPGLASILCADAINTATDGDDGAPNNPDVWVDPDTGETYPVGPGNVLGDSLGNIRDVLGL